MKLRALKVTRFEDFVEKTATFYIIRSIYHFELLFEVDLFESFDNFVIITWVFLESKVILDN